MNHEEIADQIRREMKAENDEVRKTIIRLLQINNPSETIVGACNNRMQEVLWLREENAKLKLAAAAVQCQVSIMGGAK